MKVRDAMDLIRPAVGAGGGTWADFGAGSGTFTRALAAITGPEARVLAVDRDPRALESLRRLAERHDPGRAPIVAVDGDVRRLDAITRLASVELDGAVFANVLHFVREPGSVLERAAARVREHGRLVVIEYDGVPASRWVPYPVPIDRLRIVARRAGLSEPEIVTERPSAYRGTLYCAVVVRRAS